MRKSLCPHHWVIDFAVGPLSRGECRSCGEERLFRNHLMWSEVAPLGVMKDLRVPAVDPGSAPRGWKRQAASLRGAGRRGDDAADVPME